jgi:hypothetical protein
MGNKRHLPGRQMPSKDFRDLLATWRMPASGHMTFLVTSYGKPFSTAGLPSTPANYAPFRQSYADTLEPCGGLCCLPSGSRQSACHHRGMANDGDEIAVTSRLHPDDAEAVLGVLVTRSTSPASTSPSDRGGSVFMDAHRTGLVAEALARRSDASDTSTTQSLVSRWVRGIGAPMLERHRIVEVCKEGRAQAALRERAARLAGVGMAKPGRKERWIGCVSELRPIRP